MTSAGRHWHEKGFRRSRGQNLPRAEVKKLEEGEEGKKGREGGSAEGMNKEGRKASCRDGAWR